MDRKEEFLKPGERLDDLQNGYWMIQNPSLFCYGIDAVLLASEPSIRAEYGPDGHLQTIYRISASDGRETACDPAEWPLAEMS